MKTEKEIKEIIKAREAEKQSLISVFEKRTAEVQKIVEEHNQQRAQVMLSLSHIDGCVSQLQALLPTPKKQKSKKK